MEEIVDAGQTGAKPLAVRPGGARVAALMASTKPSVDAIVVIRLDRLGRDAAESLDLFRRFRKGAVGLVSVIDQVDLSSAHGRALAGVAAIFAELERSLISARTIEALEELKRQGRPWNHPPLGWKTVDGALVEDPKEQESLQFIREAREAGLSYARTANLLAEKGLPTKRGGRWAAATVRSALLAQPA